VNLILARAKDIGGGQSSQDGESGGESASLPVTFTSVNLRLDNLLVSEYRMLLEKRKKVYLLKSSPVIYSLTTLFLFLHQLGLTIPRT